MTTSSKFLIVLSIYVCLADYIPSSQLEYSGATLDARLEMAQTWNEIMEVLGADRRFQHEYWGRSPHYAHVPAIRGCFSVNDVRDAVSAGNVLAGQNAFLVRNPESFETAPGLARGRPLTPDILESGLLNGTMVLNDAAAAWVKLFDVVRPAVRAFGLPVNVNVYITHSSLDKSTPLHTDRQDVFIAQCEGRKHWRVHGPLVPLPAEHQERGKGGDIVHLAEVGPLLFEATLSEGDLLYVPRGFTHATSGLANEHKAEGADAFSTSLTIGVQTESMGFTYDKLLLCTLFLYGEGPTLDELRELTSRHEELRQPLPFPRTIVATNISSLAEAAGDLLKIWPELFPRAALPPQRLVLKASKILSEGLQRSVQEYTNSMFDAKVPMRLRQELWRRRYGALVYKMLGQCGFLTRCFSRKFWLPKYTTHQKCWAKPG